MEYWYVLYCDINLHTQIPDMKPLSEPVELHNTGVQVSNIELIDSLFIKYVDFSSWLEAHQHFIFPPRKMPKERKVSHQHHSVDVFPSVKRLDFAVPCQAR